MLEVKFHTLLGCALNNALIFNQSPVFHFKFITLEKNTIIFRVVKKPANFGLRNFISKALTHFESPLAI